ncbi:glycoside hydrolase family 75 protein [Periconia macrospinosa]|uniref:Endo-chitosanase n=1 Tax=Periconia macrospinosa TaxID=97972 RepID=A0A2V1E3V7_9PLEO|nr:glycoside hydrolase family 75 protein [Periconia macrospinosa]
MRTAASVTLLLASLAVAREVPANLKSFYDSHKNGKCANPVSIAYNSGQKNADTHYCKDNGTGAIYLKDTSNGYADVDIDCDGSTTCEGDGSWQGQTAFKDQVSKFSNGAIKDLNTHIHTFVVLGNDNSKEEGDGGKKFDATKDGKIEPLSVVAVVCGDKLVYGVYGDINGGKVTGESSLALAKTCFPNEGLNGNKGHTKHDVLYLAFPGSDAVAKSAKWGAKTAAEFEASLAAIGDKLVKKIGSGTKSRIMRGTL